MRNLDELSTCFGRLFFRLHRLLDRRMAARGASLARTKLLLFVQNEGPARAADIAEFFSLAPRTVTEGIDALEREGLVRREPDPKDRRAKRISITDAGRAAAAETEPLRRQLVADIFGVLNEQERAQFAVLVERLSGSVDAEEARESGTS